MLDTRSLLNQIHKFQYYSSEQILFEFIIIKSHFQSLAEMKVDFSIKHLFVLCAYDAFFSVVFLFLWVFRRFKTLIFTSNILFSIIIIHLTHFILIIHCLMTLQISQTNYQQSSVDVLQSFIILNCCFIQKKNYLKVLIRSQNFVVNFILNPLFTFFLNNVKY